MDEDERSSARLISEEIARHSLTKDKIPLSHYPEAEAMALLGRESLPAVEILLDELAAREIAKIHGLLVIGFPGLLIRACRAGQLTADDVRDAMLKCVALGTHYSSSLIDQVYERLRMEIQQ